MIFVICKSLLFKLLQCVYDFSPNFIHFFSNKRFYLLFALFFVELIAWKTFKYLNKNLIY